MVLQMVEVPHLAADLQALVGPGTLVLVLAVGVHYRTNKYTTHQ